MKRSIISIALSLALVLTSMCAMFVMPASAANGVDFLTSASISAQEGITAEIVDGELVITATAAGQEVALVVEEAVNLNDYPFWTGVLTSDMPYDICWNDANNGKWIFGAGDFCYNFAGNQGAGSPLAAGSEDVKFSLTGAYTWDGSALPANAAIKQIIFIAKGAGTMTVSACSLTDGIDDISLNSASYNAEDTWDNSISVSNDPADWSASANNTATSDIVLANDAEGNLVFGNTGGAYPSAYSSVDLTVPYEGSAVYFDFSVTREGQTTVYLFFGNATETDFTGEGKGFYGVVGDVQVGNYSGYVYIQDMIPADSDLIDANGNVTISYIKAFGTTAAAAATAVDQAMVLREATVLYDTVVVEPETYITYTVESLVHEGDIAEGEEITFAVNATATDDFCGFNFDIAYDDATFEFVDAAWGIPVSNMAEGTLMEVNDTIEAVDGVKEVRVTVQGSGANVIAEGDALVFITLKAKTAVAENVEIAINDPEVTSNASVIGKYELVAECVNGIIEIVAPAYILGDVNSDEEIDMFDVLRLFKHVGEEITLEGAELAAADVNADEEVDMFDVLRLFKFVGEEIEEL